jgi:hypothetical protein
MSTDSLPKIKNAMKKLGWATVLFFIVKGTISTILLLYAGSFLAGC